MAAKYPEPPVGKVPASQPAPTGPAKVHDILGQRTGLDDTLPPTPLKQLLAAGGANVYVLSTDPELCATVQRAGGEQYPVFMVTSWPELIAVIDSGRCGIALLDAAMLGDRLAKRIRELQQYAGRLVTLVAADRSDAQELISYLSERLIHRLLIKPPALGITRLLLESAVSRCIQLREQPTDVLATRTDLRPTRRSFKAPGGARMPAWVLATALVSLLVGAVVVTGLTQWWLPQTPSEPAPAAAPLEAPPPIEVAAPLIATVAPAPETVDRFSELLGRAELAFREGRVAAPQGDNALDYYRTILGADAEHARAREGLDTVLEALFGQAERALLEGSLDAVANVLASVRLADPASGRLAFLEAQLERARAAADEAAAARAAAATELATASQAAMTVVPPAPSEAPAASEPAPAAPQQSAARAPTELESLLAIAAARMERGQLVAPNGDSARAYLDRAAEIDTADSRVLAMREQFAAALVTVAGEAVAAGDPERATSLVAEARRAGASAESLAPLNRGITDLHNERTQVRHAGIASTVRARLLSDALIAPAGDSALDHLNTLVQENSTLEELPALWSALTGALTTKARDALVQRDWNGAEQWVAALDGTGRDVGAVEALERQVQTGRLQEQYLRTPAPAGELELASYSPPEYPPDALRRQIEGWVELEFIVDRNGGVRDLVAVAAEPPGRFEQAAIAAVAQYRYQPFVRDGQTYERRVRLPIRFTLQ